MTNALKKIKKNVARLKFNAKELDVMLESARVKGRMEGIKYTLDKLEELGHTEIIEELKMINPREGLVPARTLFEHIDMTGKRTFTKEETNE
jgi:excinuclease UvrABC helicase subunit UvrB